MYLLFAGLAVLGFAFRLVAAVISSFNACLTQIEVSLKLLRRLSRRRSKSKRDASPRKGGRP